MGRRRPGAVTVTDGDRVSHGPRRHRRRDWWPQAGTVTQAGSGHGPLARLSGRAVRPAGGLGCGSALRLPGRRDRPWPKFVTARSRSVSAPGPAHWQLEHQCHSEASGWQSLRLTRRDLPVAYMMISGPHSPSQAQAGPGPAGDTSLSPRPGRLSFRVRRPSRAGPGRCAAARMVASILMLTVGQSCGALGSGCPPGPARWTRRPG